MAHNLTSQLNFAEIKLKSTTSPCSGNSNRTETCALKSEILLLFLKILPIVDFWDSFKKNMFLPALLLI